MYEESATSRIESHRDVLPEETVGSDRDDLESGLQFVKGLMIAGILCIPVWILFLLIVG
jgi:hypothetical protein